MKIDPELEKLIPPLSDEEFKQLEKNCCEYGIRDALVVGVFPGSDGEVLVDGHNRYKIAQKCNLSFTEKRLDFASKEKAIEWIITNQLGRRNIDEWVKFDLIKRLDEVKRAEAKERQGKRNDLNIVETLPPSKKTRDAMGELIGVSGKTYDKMKKIDELGTPEIKAAARKGEISTNEAFKRTIDKIVKPRDPVKEAKERHEQFQEAKQNSVVDFQQAKQDETDKELLSIDLYQEICKAVHGFDKLALLRDEEQIGELFDSMEKYCFGDLSNRLTRTYRLILWLQRELEERR